MSCRESFLDSKFRYHSTMDEDPEEVRHFLDKLDTSADFDQNMLFSRSILKN